MYEDRPNEVLIERARYNAFVSNPYRDSIIGRVSDIKKITKEDILELVVKKQGDMKETTFQFSRALAEKNKKLRVFVAKKGHTKRRAPICVKNR